MLGFDIGLSGIRSNQIGLDVTSNNIANADNPDYHRQFAGLAARPGLNVDNFLLGSGVEVSRIRRSFAFLVQDSIIEKQSDQNSVARRFESTSQIESLLSPGSGAIRNQFEALYNELTELTAGPNDTVRRQIVIERAQSFTQEFNHISSNLTHLQLNAQSRIQGQVDQANQLFKELGKVATQIRSSDFENAPPNQLLDKRDAILGELSSIVDVKLYEKPGGEFTILAAGQRLFVGNNPIQLEATNGNDGQVRFSAKGFEGDLSFRGGSLHGLAEVVNQTIPDVRNHLDILARDFSFAFDKAHSTGINAFGGFDLLTSSRSISDVNIPLAETESAFPIKSGELFVGVTDTNTGIRTLHRIEIDPQTESLTDLANKLSAIGGLQTAVDSQQGTFSISSDTGIQFDFAGRLPTGPDLTNVTGSSAPLFSGQYSGDVNQQLTFTASGTGDVGVGDPLTLNVFNEAGALVNQVNVGTGYEPGSPIEVFEGIALSFPSGSLNDGDTFSTHAVADADTSEVLVALGLNTFFSGVGAGDIDVNRQILDDHRYLATSKNGDAGDSGNIFKLLESRGTSLASLGNRTFEGFIDEIVRKVGAEVSILTQEQTNLDAQLHRLESEKASITGVDPNEEFVRMMQFQRAFEMSSRVISVTNENLQTLLSMVG